MTKTRAIHTLLLLAAGLLSLGLSCNLLLRHGEASLALLAMY